MDRASSRGEVLCGWGSEVYLSSYTHPKEARAGLARYVDFYNHHRPHQALAYRTPAEVYFGASDHRVRRGAEKGRSATPTTTGKGDTPTLELPSSLWCQRGPL